MAKSTIQAASRGRRDRVSFASKRSCLRLEGQRLDRVVEGRRLEERQAPRFAHGPCREGRHVVVALMFKGIDLAEAGQAAEAKGSSQPGDAIGRERRRLHVAGVLADPCRDQFGGGFTLAGKSVEYGAGTPMDDDAVSIGFFPQPALSLVLWEVVRHWVLK